LKYGNDISVLKGGVFAFVDSCE